MPATIVVTGRLVRDFEKKSDKAPFSSSIAVDGLVKVGDEYQTKFYDLVVWAGNSQAGAMLTSMAAKNSTLKKASIVTVTGTPSYEVYKDKDTGDNRVSERIKVEKIEFVPTSKREGGSADTETSGSSDSTTNAGGLTLQEDIPML